MYVFGHHFDAQDSYVLSGCIISCSHTDVRVELEKWREVVFSLPVEWE